MFLNIQVVWVISTMLNKTAIIIISHNQKTITDNLCNNIITNTKSPYDLYVIETGSQLSELSSHATFWVKDGIRMTRGFNWGIKYALWKEKFIDTFYDSFWLLVNDSILDNIDTLTPLVNFIKENKNCGEVHPFIKNSSSSYLKQTQGIARKESFVEIVCPCFSRKAIELNLFDDDFFYGWGLDYEIPYLLHKNKLNLYIHNGVGVVHNAGTTVTSGKDEAIKTIQNQFTVSRNNMIEILTKKYGNKWGEVFLKEIPSDVPKNAFVDWVENIGCNYKF